MSSLSDCNQFPIIPVEDYSAYSVLPCECSGVRYLNLSRQKPIDINADKNRIEKIQNLVQKILGTKLNEMIPPQPSSCNSGSLAMSACCIKTFGKTNLRICGCPKYDLNMRNVFEMQVIIKVLEKIYSPQVKNPFQVTIAVYGSGFVGTEISLFTRLQKILNDDGISGDISIILIDRDYKAIVEKGSLKDLPLYVYRSQQTNQIVRSNRNHAIAASLADFVDCLALQNQEVSPNQKQRINLYTNITTENSYKEMCEKSPNLRADLFIGVDIDQSLKEAQTLYHYTKLNNREKIQNDTSDAVILCDEGNGIKFWGTNLSTDFDTVKKFFEECTAPLPSATPVEPENTTFVDEESNKLLENTPTNDFEADEKSVAASTTHPPEMLSEPEVCLEQPSSDFEAEEKAAANTNQPPSESLQVFNASTEVNTVETSNITQFNALIVEISQDILGKYVMILNNWNTILQAAFFTQMPLHNFSEITEQLDETTRATNNIFHQFVNVLATLES